MDFDLDTRMLPDPLPANPWPLLQEWFDDARQSAGQPNPNSLYLGTVDPEGRPSVRTVLCKGIHTDLGHIVFYTNYESRKASDLEATGRAAALMHWDKLDKQIRIEGRVVRSPAEESDAYFRSRRLLSRIGAWASEQSRPIADHDELMLKVAETAARFGVPLADVLDPKADAEIPRPPHWGGYRLVADRVELWLGADGRLHDRAQWRRELPDDLASLTPFKESDWSASRLQP